MKVATWNINSLRARLPHVLDWLDRQRPDLLALQEIKVADDQCPLAELQAAGYQTLISGQKAYNGVAILSRTPTDGDVIRDLPGFEDTARRVLAARYGSLRVINLYVPNGQSVDSDKYLYKLEWLQHLTVWLRDELARHEHLMVVGDFNIAPEPRDVYDPRLWQGRVLFSEPERTAFHELLDLGLADAFRLFDQEAGAYSWWDYRMNGFRRNRGLRIDHILVSRSLAKRCVSCTIDRAPRGLERPSDHAPVLAEFEL